MRQLKIFTSMHAQAIEEWVNDFFKKCKDSGTLILNSTYTCCPGAYVAYIEYEKEQEPVAAKDTFDVNKYLQATELVNKVKGSTYIMKDDPAVYDIVGDR